MHFIVIGAGAGGLASAVLLAKDSHKVDVYDSLAGITYSPEESYPIGITSRGQRTLKYVDEAMYQEFLSEGFVSSWDVYMNTFRLARNKSGTTIGSTRGNVVLSLYQQALKYNENINFHFGHKLTDIDFTSKKLTFEKDETKDAVIVDASSSKLIASDGVWSKTRRLLADYDVKFQSEALPWHAGFRTVVSNPNPQTTLSGDIHYIFAGAGIYVAKLPNGIWTVVFQLTEKEEEKWLWSDEATAENVSKLKEWVRKHASMAQSLIPEEEYTNYFSRRIFTGAVTKVSRLNHEDWVVLLGDAAHGVLPPTGEGINSCLEDVLILHRSIRDSTEHAFEKYNEVRFEDVQSLSSYAEYVLKSWFSTNKQKTAVMVTDIAVEIGVSVGLLSPSWGGKSFGDKSANVDEDSVRYSDLHKVWTKNEARVRPIANFVAWFVRD